MDHRGSQEPACAVTASKLKLVEVEITPDALPATEDPENFDLYEWAIEFSKAAGFEIEHGPIAVED